MKGYINRQDPMGRKKGLELRAAVLEAYKAIPEEFLWRLMESMPRRCAEVIALKGGLTKW